MNFHSRNNFAVLLALLTKRMQADVAVTNPFPCTAILLVDVRGTLVLVVLPAGNGNMVRTILSVRQSGAAWIGTGSLGFTWHGSPPS